MININILNRSYNWLMRACVKLSDNIWWLYSCPHVSDEYLDMSETKLLLMWIHNTYLCSWMVNKKTNKKVICIFRKMSPLNIWAYTDRIQQEQRGTQMWTVIIRLNTRVLSKPFPRALVAITLLYESRLTSSGAPSASTLPCTQRA